MQKSVINQEVRRLADPSNRREGGNLFALIDGALHRPALQETKAFARPHSIVPAGGIVARSDLSALPFLVELDAQNAHQGNRLITRLAAWALDHAAVTLLSSALPLSVLAEQLALRMDAELTQNMSVVLRFSDARVLPILHNTLDEEQRTRFFAIAMDWWYVSRQGELQALPLQPAPSASLQSFKPPLQLNATQEQQLLDAAEPDSVIQILRRHDAQAIDAMAPGARYDFVKTGIARAKTWSLATPTDLALFCLVALAHGPTFDETTDWSAALTQVRAGNTTLIQAIQQQTPPT